MPENCIYPKYAVFQVFLLDNRDLRFLALISLRCSSLKLIYWHRQRVQYPEVVYFKIMLHNISVEFNGPICKFQKKYNTHRI